MNSPGLSRRALLASTATGALAATITGWNTATAAWATHNGPDIAELPTLDGTMTLQGEGLERFAGDFGHLVTATPRAVLHPGSVRDVQQLITFARNHRIPIAVNGQSGDLAQYGTNGLESHSSFGQANPRGGIAIDARGLSGIHSVHAERAIVGAGTTWAQVIEATLPHGWVPPVLPDYLHLTVGGTLSVGGIGAGVQRHGMQVDNVLELDIVTGTGELLTASPTHNRELFDATLAGAGQAGIIVRATLALTKARERAHVYSLYYDDLNTYLTDQHTLLTTDRFDYQTGDVLRNTDNTHWRYKAELVALTDTGQTPDTTTLLAGLNPTTTEIVEQSWHEYAYRVDTFANYLRSTGLWNQPKPWLSLFLPASTAATFMTEATEILTPDDIGAGLLLFYPYKHSKIHTPLAVLPQHEEIGWHFDLLSFPNPHTDTTTTLQRNRHLYNRAVALGGKRYLIGAIPNMTQTDWQHHYGPLWNQITQTK
uniref:FAD-binding protein n=1 Tax=Kitasatospora brasiliensis TaxID=3058040 RepID=UPI002931F37B